MQKNSYGNNNRRAVPDDSLEGVVKLDLEGNIIFVDEKLKEAFGYKQDDVIGRNGADFLDKENLNLFLSKLNDRKNGLSSLYKISFKTKTGDIWKMQVKGSPLLNGEGEVIGSIGVVKYLSDPLYLNDPLKENSIDSEKINEVLGSLNLAYWVFSIKEKKIEFLSPGFESIYETSIEEIYRENSVRKYIHPDDLSNVITRNRQNLNCGEFELEYRIITPTGKTKWVHDKASILKDAKGKPDKIIGYAQDITKLKQVKEKLVKSEQEKEGIIRSVPYSFIIVDNNYEIVRSYFKSHERNVLIPGTKFIEGKKISQAFNRIASGTLENLIESVLKSGEQLKTEMEMEANCITTWFEVNVTAMGEQKALLVFKDITSGKSNIVKIQKLFNITPQSKELVVITDHAGRVEYVNPVFTKLTGYSSAELLGSSMNILKSGKHPQGFYKEMWKTLLKKRTFKGNFINRKKDGQIFVEEKIITSFINMNGEITNYISIGRDVTNLRNLTKLGLRQDTKVTAENETAGSLSLIQKQENDQKHLAKKIHEGLNQMLSAVRMNLESLNMSGSLKTTERKKVDFVSEVLSEIIQELRGISTSLSPASLYQFGLYSSVNQYINKLNKITTFKLNSNIEGLRFESDIEINYYRIIQEAVKNIITHSNATDAEINLFYSEKGLTLHILDNGKGIDKRALKKMKMQKLGLLNIEERAKSINSRLLIRTRTKMGFEIILKTKTNPLHP